MFSPRCGQRGVVGKCEGSGGAQLLCGALGTSRLSECEKLLEPTGTVQFSVALTVSIGVLLYRGISECLRSHPPHLMAIRTHVQLRHAHTWAHGHTHTGLGTCLPHLHRSPLLGDASVLFPVVISVSAALRSLPWGLRPLLPVFVCCPVSAPGPGSCAVNSPFGLPAKPGAAKCPGAALAPSPRCGTVPVQSKKGEQ